MKIKFILWIDFTFLSFPFLPQHISIIVPILRSWTRGGSQPATIQRKWHGELCRSALLPVPASQQSKQPSGDRQTTLGVGQFIAKTRSRHC